MKLIESYTTTHDSIPAETGKNDGDRTSGDCISRQQAIDALKEKVFHNLSDEFYGAMQVLDELPSVQPEQRWIPTSVKPYPNLPEEDVSGYFLVTLHTYGNIGFNMDEYELKKMRWDRVNGWVVPVHSPAWIEEALTQDVLAWMPLPERYQEGGEQDG